MTMRAKYCLRDSSMPCLCADYPDLELDRSSISKRNKASAALKDSLSLAVSHPDKEHRLYRCDACGQLWQRALAWNWGQIEYLFKVPGEDESEWIAQPFVDPDELLIWSATMETFLSRGKFVAQDAQCAVAECTRKAVAMSKYCLLHHIESVQRSRGLLPTPNGRWFAPYLGLSPAQLADYITTYQPGENPEPK
jgi:hypothetical protein